MKRTLDQFQISNHLETPVTERPPIREDSAQAGFARDLHSLDRRLRDSCTPAPSAPPWLHAAIMNQVRGIANESHARPRGRRFRLVWFWPMMCLTLMIAVGVLMYPGPTGPDMVWRVSQADADAVVRQAASQGALVMMQPFEIELISLSEDLDRTTRFLMASLP